MNSARLLEDVTIPPGMEIECGSPFRKVWRLENSGRRRWKSCRLMRLGGTFQPAVSGQPAPDIAPGETADLPVELAAPAAPGRAEDRWQLHDAAGRPFGPILLVRIQAVPGGAPNGLPAGTLTDDRPERAVVAAGQPFSHTLLLENTGGRRWRVDDALVFLGGDAEPEATRYPLPATIPGERNQLTVRLRAGRASGIAVTYWQFRDHRGVPFGAVVSPEVEVTPPEEVALPFDPHGWRRVIWDITGVFESGRAGGNPAAFQNRDEGIISYGRHQATLQSGNLGRVLTLFCQRSQSPASAALRAEYLDRVLRIDPTLRHDDRLRALLLEAAAEPAMNEAQDDVFAEGFYTPVIGQARALGLATPLGLACLYDTRIQHGGGGLEFILGLTNSGHGPPPGEGGLPEATWLGAFLDEREGLLNRLAAKRQQEAESAAEAGRRRSLQQTAEALRISTFRVRELRTLLQAGNLGLQGPLTIRGQSVTGL